MTNARLCVTLLVCLAVSSLPLAAQCTPPVCTQIFANGPDPYKLIMVVMGDGYAAADQHQYNADVDRLLVDGAFAHDLFAENHNAFNLYRLNLISAESGMSQRRYDENGTPTDPGDDTILSTTMKETALRIIWSGSWAHCWLEPSAQTWGRIQSALSSTVPYADYVVILLNEDRFGGCGSGSFQIVPRGVDWPVLSHELGHGVGALWDEYAFAGHYPGLGVNNANCSTLVDRTAVFWNRFISPATPVPTTFAPGMDESRTVGEFEGCATFKTGIYRPVESCRMRRNESPFCPVCYTLMKRVLAPHLGHDFANLYRGDFDGDGRDDLLIHNGADLAIYRSESSRPALERWWVANNLVPAAPGHATWHPRPGDRYQVGDFDGDGRDDLLAFNGRDWIRPYLAVLRAEGEGLRVAARYDGKIAGLWSMAPDDQHLVADFDGDGKDDLVLWNGRSWSQPYLGLARSLGGPVAGVRRYAGFLPEWTMGPGDRFHVGDFDGDGKDDLYVWNGDDWPDRYLAMMRSTGEGLERVRLFANALPGWTPAPGDRFQVGDFDGDGRDDLYAFNGTNWASAYLAMLRSTGDDLTLVRRYDGSSQAATVPGWALRPGDQFFLADAGADGKDDLVVFNPGINWTTEYLGVLRSTGDELRGGWTADRVGGWDLRFGDRLLVADYQAAGRRSDLFIHNRDRLALLRRHGGDFAMDRAYRQWIYSPLYDARPGSAGVPGTVLSLAAAGPATASEPPPAPRPLQSGEKNEAGSELPAMAAPPSAAAGPREGAAATAPPAPGDRQPEVDAELAAAPPLGTGAQEAPAAAAEPPVAGGYLHLLLRLSPQGEVEVISAAELPGEPLIRAEVADQLAWQVELGEETVSVGSLPDPFARRSFPGPPGTTPPGHHVSRSFGLLALKVPRAARVRERLDELRVRLYRLTPQAPVELLDAGALGRLVVDSQAERVLELGPETLAPKIRERLKMESDDGE